MTLIDISGRTFGKLTVIRRDEILKTKRRPHWICRCECGRIKSINGSALRLGITRSCGCQIAEAARNRITHGASRHGQITAEYKAWRRAKARCFQNNLLSCENYAGRGITMCSLWRQEFAIFFQDMGPQPKDYSLDRIDVNGNYSCGHCDECKEKCWPANCRWASRVQQNNNKRDNVLAVVDGVTMSLADAARAKGVSYKSVQYFLHRKHLSIEESLARAGKV